MSEWRFWLFVIGYNAAMAIGLAGLVWFMAWQYATYGPY